MTLDREPKETVREESAVCLFLYLYVCVCVCICVEKVKENKEGKTVGGTGDDREKSKG